MIDHGSDERWNHNIHYQRLILRAVPPHAETALDVGCGEGMLARELARMVPRVTAIDLHEPSLALARKADLTGSVDFLNADFLTFPFAPASFDVIASIAALHHMDEAVALDRMRALLRPGGRLIVIGCAKSRSLRDVPFEIAGAVTTRVLAARKGHWRHSAPIVWPPPTSYGDLRRLARRALPGSSFRRLVLWRYALIWTKPAA